MVAKPRDPTWRRSSKYPSRRRPRPGSYRLTPKRCPTRAGRLAAVRPVRPPAPAPPGTPTPIRGRRRSPITPRQAFLLEATSKGVSGGVKAVARTRRLVLATEFLGRDTRGQGQGQCAHYQCERSSATPPLASVSLNARYELGTPQGSEERQRARRAACREVSSHKALAALGRRRSIEPSCLRVRMVVGRNMGSHTPR